MIALAHHHSEATAVNQPQGRRTVAELTKTVSATRLTTWQRCRLQFYFRYVAGIQKSPTPALHIGTTVHTVLQQWNLARWHGRELEAQELREIFSRSWKTKCKTHIEVTAKPSLAPEKTKRAHSKRRSNRSTP
jgi:ATP-dependent helicase/DNAse subunit B